MNTTGFCILVSGPTGVGKTAFVDVLAQELPAEIVNGDMGQLYTPLTIGTAKPDYKNGLVPHHMFDVIDNPELFTVMEFRKKVAEICAAIWQRNNIPIIVGGSGYYLTSLFFPPAQHDSTIKKNSYDPDQDLWFKLNTIDPVRAKEIDAGDRYRIERALDIWYSTGIKPSRYAPKYDPIFSSYIFAWITRDRDDLYHRIDARVHEMVDAGWIEEVENLLGTPWQDFLESKKIIGYPEVIAYCREIISKREMIAIIAQKSRNYAKRQMTFMRMLKKKLLEAQRDTGVAKNPLIECNLTHESVPQYSKHLVHLAKQIVGQYRHE